MIEEMKRVTLYQGDCLELMKDIQDETIDMILCDLPYGTTDCGWDTVIPFDLLWEQYQRIIKNNCAIVLFGSQPFTSSLLMSKSNWFKHSWIWQKNAGSNFGTTKYQPMKEHEDILIFCKRGKRVNYYPILEKRKGSGAARVQHLMNYNSQAQVYSKGNLSNKVTKMANSLRVPSSIQKFNRERGFHPTQKPVPLLEYLIKTYTQEDELVLDNCMGSGSTGIACLNNNRQFIGMELNKTFFNIAKNRIREHNQQLKLF